MEGSGGTLAKAGENDVVPLAAEELGLLPHHSPHAMYALAQARGLVLFMVGVIFGVPDVEPLCPAHLDVAGKLLQARPRKHQRKEGKLFTRDRCDESVESPNISLNAQALLPLSWRKITVWV